jgi:hypothetical protein
MSRILILVAATITVTLGPLFGQDSFGQFFQFGIRGGIPLIDPIHAGFIPFEFLEQSSSANRRYTVGPTVELRLPHGFSLEVEALYEPLGFAEVSVDAEVIDSYIHASADNWNFPLLAKYRLPLFRAVHPYVDVGPSFRTVTGVSATTTSWNIITGQVTGPVHSTSDPHFSDRSHVGLAVGMGTQFRVGLLRFSPEVRYTRWMADQPGDPFLYSNQNQVDVLLGITF